MNHGTMHGTTAECTQANVVMHSALTHCCIIAVYQHHTPVDCINPCRGSHQSIYISKSLFKCLGWRQAIQHSVHQNRGQSAKCTADVYLGEQSPAASSIFGLGTHRSVQ